jgi:hypothetical protein
MMGGHEGVAHRILITLRFRVRHARENRRVRGESVIGFSGTVFPKSEGVFNSLFL